MIDKRTTPEAPEGAPQAAPERSRRKKRAAPTIDLTATEVPPPQDAAPQSDPAPEPAPPPEAPTSAAPSPEPPRAKPPRNTRYAAYGIALVAGFAGAVIMAGIVTALWLADVLPIPGPSDQRAQIGVLARQMQALQDRPAPAIDNKAIDALNARLAGIASTLTALNSRSDEITAAAGQARERADAAAKAVADFEESAKANASAGASRADLEVLGKRLAALESAAQSAQSDIGKIAAKTSGNDQAARLALSAVSLRDAVTSGTPFAVELAQAKALGADDKILAPLASFASTGVPAAPALAHELNALLPSLIKKADAAAPQGGFLDRLQANAGKLVRIRPVSAPPGDEPSAVLTRLEIDAAKVDIAAALADLGRLDEATRAPAQGWIEKAQARQAALAAAKQFAADTARALGPKAAAQ
jgi:hypothetical protein